MFCFLKDKNKYVWQNEELKLAFYDASLQAHDEFKYVKSENDILYFYYSMCLSIKKPFEDQWKKVVTAYVGDFPAIFALKEAIKTALNSSESFDDYEKIPSYGTKNDNIQRFQKTWSLDGSFSQDTYILSKFVVVDEDETNTQYSLYIGGAVNPQGDRLSHGVNIYNLAIDDLKQLVLLLETFIGDACFEYSQRSKYYIDKNINTFFTVNDKYLVQKIKNRFQEFLAIGDVVDLTVMQGSLQDDSYFSKSYSQTTVVECGYDDDDYVIVNGGYDEETSEPICNAKILAKQIIYAMRDVPDDVVACGQEQIEDEFYDLIKDSGFIIQDVDSRKESLKTWKEIFVNRWWIYRSEHGFVSDNMSYDRRDQIIDDICFSILKTTKKKLEEES